MTGKPGRPRKFPADPWQIVETGQLEGGQPVAIWENTASQERRVVPQGTHPAQQPLADGDVTIDEVVDDTPENRILAMMEAAKENNTTLRLYRTERTGKLSWIEDFTPGEWEEGGERMVRENYGPGDYEVRFWQRGVRSPLKGKLQLHIAGPRHRDAPPLPPPPPQQDNALAAILASIAENQRTMLQAITERPAPPDPTAEMTKMLSLMVTMRQAMGIDQQPRSQIGEIVSAIRELREASEEISPPKEEQGLLGQLPRVLDMVQTGMQAQQQTQAMPQVHQATIPTIQLPESIAVAPPLETTSAAAAPSSAASAPVARAQLRAVPPTPTPPKENAVFNPLSILQLRAYLKTLLKMAERQEPVEKAAQFVYDKAPDEILDIMALESWQDLLEEVAPEAKEHRVFLKLVRERALAMFDEEEDDDGQPAAAD